jgi:hypothetical protein
VRPRRRLGGEPPLRPGRVAEIPQLIEQFLYGSDDLLRIRIGSYRILYANPSGSAARNLDPAEIACSLHVTE